MSTARKVVRCISCKKTYPIENLRIYFQNDSPQLCSKVVQRLKQEQFQINDKNFGEDDFFNYEVEKK